MAKKKTKKKKKKYTGKPRGFTLLKLRDPDRLRALCAENGKKYGKRWTTEQARRFGAKGGRAKRVQVLSERERMSWHRH